VVVVVVHAPSAPGNRQQQEGFLLIPGSKQYVWKLLPV
jgi:hypothetical protein